MRMSALTVRLEIEPAQLIRAQARNPCVGHIDTVHGRRLHTEDMGKYRADDTGVRDHEYGLPGVISKQLFESACYTCNKFIQRFGTGRAVRNRIGIKPRNLPGRALFKFCTRIAFPLTEADLGEPRLD